MNDLRAEEHEHREAEAEGWPIGITSYRLGESWICHIDNVSPGAIIARGRGDTRQEAVAAAMALAERRLRTTRRMQQALDNLHTSVASLDAVLPEKKP